MEQSFFTGIQFIGIVQGFILFNILYKRSGKNIEATKILSYFNLLIAITLIGRFLIRLDFVPHVVGYMADCIIFAFGPLIYFFVMKFLKSPQSKTRLFWHSLPALNHIVATILLFSYGQLKPFSELIYIEQMNVISYGVFAEALAIVQIQCYLLASFYRIIISIRNERKEFSFKQFPNVFLLMMILIELAVIFWASGYTSRVFQFGIAELSYDMTWLILPLITMILTYSFLGQAEMFAISKEQKHVFSDEMIQSVNERLLNSMENDKLFTHSKLTKTELAKQLETNSSALSKTINSLHNKNFFEFINEYRVKEFINRATDEEFKSFTYIAIANDVGFHSKATFYSSFKKVYGTTPKDYLDNISA